MSQSVSAISSASAIKVLRDDGGAVYYYNSSTAETSWEKPPELEALEEKMSAMAQAAAAQPEVHTSRLPMK